MNDPLEILSISLLDHDIGRLAAESRESGFAFVDRLLIDWTSGKNRFDRDGEFFLGGFISNRLVAFGGLNRDPYTE